MWWWNFLETQKKHKPLQITPWQQVEVPMIQFQERLVEVPCVETREEPTEAQTKIAVPKMAWKSQRSFVKSGCLFFLNTSIAKQKV